MKGSLLYIVIASVLIKSTPGVYFVSKQVIIQVPFSVQNWTLILYSGKNLNIFSFLVQTLYRIHKNLIINKHILVVW